MKFPANKPCPRPGEMIVVKTKAGSFWRMKRAKGTPLNGSLNKAKSMLQTLSPAAAQFVSELRPYMLKMDPKRMNLRVKSCMQRSIKNRGELDYSYMEKLDFQPEYPLWKLMRSMPYLTDDGKDVVMQILIPEGGAVKAHNIFVTGYKFMLIMVVGDPIEDKLLRTYDVSSDIYQTGRAVEKGCELRLIKPDKGEKWICILHIISYEGKEMAINPRHFGMKVLGWDSKQMLKYGEAGLDTAGVNWETETGSELTAGVNLETTGVNEKVGSLNEKSAGVNEPVNGLNGKSAGVNEDISEAVDRAIAHMIDKARADLRENIRMVAFVISREPGLRLPEIALKTDLSVRSLERHIKHLKDAGVIEYRGSTKTGGYYLSNRA